jgi:hypothetical protein
MTASMKYLAVAVAVEVSVDAEKGNFGVEEAGVAISAAVEMASSAVDGEGAAAIAGMASTEAAVVARVVVRAVDPEAEVRHRVERQRREPQSVYIDTKRLEMTQQATHVQVDHE